MLASILVPVRNGEAYLERALDSIPRAAGKVAYEVVMQDCVSEDRTQEIATSHTASIRYYREADSGQPNALNRALAKASGDFIGWFNADDLYMPGAIERAADIFARDASVDVVYGDFNVIDSGDHVLRAHRVDPWSWRQLFLKGNYVFTGATFFRASVFQHFGTFREDLHFVADLEFFLRVGADVNAVYARSILGAFRYHRGSKSGSHALLFCREAAPVRRPYVSVGRVTRVDYARAQAEMRLSAALARVRYTRTYSALRGALSRRATDL